MKHADRVAVEETVREYVKDQKSPSRPFVLMLDGNRIGDFDTREYAKRIGRYVVHSLEEDWPFAAWKERFDDLSVMHAKMSAKYRELAKEIVDNAVRTEDAPTTDESIGTPGTDTAP